MTTPDGNAIYYPASIEGTLDPGSVYPLDSILHYAEAQQAGSNALHSLLGPDIVDFHLIARTGDTEPLYRARWRLRFLSGGPLLRPFADEPHDSSITARLVLRPLTEDYQLALPLDDEQRPEMPYRTLLSGLYTALLLRRGFGTEPQQVTIGEFGTATFTPHTLTYMPPLADEPTSTPIHTQPLVEYPFEQADDGTQGRALWLAITGAPAGEGWKVSYCAPYGTGPEARWDDPDEAVPEYEPVEFTPPVAPAE